jgi:mTERF domain-containing protein
VDKLRPGLSVPQIASFLAVGSRAVRKCPDVGPNIQFWVNLCGSFEQAIVFIKRSNSLLMSDLDRVIKPNLTSLHQCGISVQDIAHLCSRNPQMLTISLERLKEVMQCVEEFGVPPSSGMFNHVVAAVSCNTKEKHIARLELKSALGCSRSHVATAVSKAPTIITMSEENLLRKIQFLTNAVGFELHYILQRPVLLLYSLEKRLVPQHYVIKVLVTKGLLKTNVNFYTIAIMGEKAFSSKFINSHKDSVPGLADAFAAACGGKVPPGDQL